MSISLKQVLELVGKLDDSPGEDVPRERFRHFLQEQLTEVGQIRDFVQECLMGSGDQYSRALQDLIVYNVHITHRVRGLLPDIGLPGIRWPGVGRLLTISRPTTRLPGII